MFFTEILGLGWFLYINLSFPSRQKKEKRYVGNVVVGVGECLEIFPSNDFL